MTHLDDISKFRERVFSGADLLAIMDMIGVGVGSTLHVVGEIEFEQQREATTFRQWTFPKELTSERVLAMLISQENHDNLR